MPEVRPIYPIRLIFVAALLLLLLFTGWLTVKGDYREEFKSTIRDDVEEMDEIIDAYDEYEAYASWIFGSDFDKSDMQSVRRFIAKLADGSISPLDAGTMAPRLSKVLSIADTMGLDASGNLKSAQCWMWIYTIVFWLTLIAGILTAVSCIMGKQSVLGYVFAGGILLLFISFAVMTSKLNDGTNAFRLTFWAFAGLLLAVGTVLVGKIHIAGTAAVNTVSNAKRTINADGMEEPGWTCAMCGSEQMAASRFCSKCGAGKPEPAASGAFCHYCGARLDSASRFCPQCGTKRDGDTE